MSAFRASAGVRLALALAWGVAAFGAAAGVAARRVSPASFPAPPPSPVASAMLRVEFSATFDAESWRAALDGVDVSIDPAVGVFDVEARRGAVLVVEARSSDFFGERDQAMRVRVLRDGRAREYAAWGRGDLAVRIDLDEAAPP